MVEGRTIAALGFLLVAASGCGESQPPSHFAIPGADPQRGKALIVSYGCGACHTVEGVAGANGTVAPPLVDFASRTLIAGTFPNVPRNLVRWVMDPPGLKPDTAMPNLGITTAEASHIASYLYTLGQPASEQPLASDLSEPSRAEFEALRDEQMKLLQREGQTEPGFRQVPIDQAIEFLATQGSPDVRR